MNHLVHIFHIYDNAYGQIINLEKFNFYVSFIFRRSIMYMCGLLDFLDNNFPFTYFRVSSFKGKPKTVPFQEISNKIKTKFDTLSCSLLYIIG